jgi:hypothetical protein
MSTEHHDQGPSQLKSLALCPGFMPNETWHEITDQGSLGHYIWETGDRSKASGYPDLLGLVDKLDHSWTSHLLALTTGMHTGNHFTIQSEVRMEYPGLNFGTMDKKVLVPRTKFAIVGDAKFGRWGVDEAKDNLQGQNYAIYVLHENDWVRNINLWFGNPRREEYTNHTFSRDYILNERLPVIKQIVSDAQEADPAKFKYDPVNCSFCARVNCPVRLNLASSLVAAASGQSFRVDHLNPKKLETKDLATLKPLTLALKTLVTLVDKESKDRVIVRGEDIEGYELKQKVSRRFVQGLKAYKIAAHILERELGTVVDVSECVELAFSDIENFIVQLHGSKNAAQPFIMKVREALEAAGVLTTSSYIYLAAKTENEEQ